MNIYNDNPIRELGKIFGEYEEIDPVNDYVAKRRKYENFGVKEEKYNSYYNIARRPISIIEIDRKLVKLLSFGMIMVISVILYIIGANIDVIIRKW